MYIFVCTQSTHMRLCCSLLACMQMRSIWRGSQLDTAVGAGVERDGRRGQRAPKHRSIDRSSANAAAESPPTEHLSIALQVSHVVACYFRYHVTDVAAGVGASSLSRFSTLQLIAISNTAALSSNSHGNSLRPSVCRSHAGAVNKRINQAKISRSSPSIASLLLVFV